MRRKRWWNKTLAAALSSAMVLNAGAPMVYGAEFSDGEVTAEFETEEEVFLDREAELEAVEFSDEAKKPVVLAETGEQFQNLEVGETYWFDLSDYAPEAATGRNSDGSYGSVWDGLNGTVEDTSLHWVPFTYVGTVNAYSYDNNGENEAGSKTETQQGSERSLFVAEYPVKENISWNALNGASLVYGREYFQGNAKYELRILSGGNQEIKQSGIGVGVSPENNEWDQMLNKAEKDNWTLRSYSISPWVQDFCRNGANAWCVRRGGNENGRQFVQGGINSHMNGYNWRPALEIVESASESGFVTVKLNLNGGMRGEASAAYEGLDGNETLNVAVASGRSFVVPGDITAPEGKEDDVLVWKYGDKYYAPGKEIQGLIDGAVLDACWVESFEPEWNGAKLEDLTYGATAEAVKTATEISNKPEDYEGTITYTYSSKEADYATDVPTDAGTYTVKVSGTGTGVYAAFEGTTEFTIAQKVLTPTITGSVTKVYDGDTTITAGATVNTLGIGLSGVIDSDNVTATATSFAYTDASVGSEKQVTATGIGLSGTRSSNYILSKTEVTSGAGTGESFAITSAGQTIEISEIGEKTYGDTNFELSTTGGSGQGAVTYGSSDDTILSISGTTATIHAAGTVTITATKAADENYSEAKATKLLTIKPKTLTPIITGSATKVYDGTTEIATGNTLGIGLEGVINNDGVTAEATSFAYTDANAGDKKQITATDITLSGEKASNYTIGMKEITTEADLRFVITKADQTVTISDIIDKTYGDGSFEFFVTSAGGTSEVTCVSSDTSVLSISPGTTANSFTATIHKAALNDKPVTITATKEADNNYNSAADTEIVTIKQKILTPSITGSVTKDYDGTTAITGNPLSIGLDGVVTGDEGEVTATASFSYTDAAAGENKKVNAINITLTGTAKINYQLSKTVISEATAGANEHFVITKAAPTMNLKVGEIKDTAGTNTRQATLTATVSKRVDSATSPTGTVTFVDITNESETTLATVNFSADGTAVYTWNGLAQQDYAVKAVYNGDTNYTTAVSEQNFDTAKYTQSITLNGIPDSVVYGDSESFEFTVTVEGDNGVGSGAVVCESSDTSVLTIAAGAAENSYVAVIHKVGNVEITVTKEEDNGYNSAFAAQSLTINPRILTPIITGSVTKVYDGTVSVGEAGDNNSLAIGLVDKNGELDLIAGKDGIGATASFEYADADAGEDKEVTAAGIELCMLGDGASSDKFNNYVLAEDKDTITAAAGENQSFVITQAENEWETGLSIEGWTYGEDVNAPVAVPKFGKGTVKFTYSDSENGAFDKNPEELLAGIRYVKAVVPEHNNYKELNAVVSFTVSSPYVPPVITPDPIPTAAPTPIPTPTPNPGDILENEDGSITITGDPEKGDVVISPGEDGEAPVYDEEKKEITTGEGNIVTFPDGSEVTPPAGSTITSDGTIKTPNDTEITSDGKITLPDGTVLTPDENGKRPTIDKDGTVTAPDGTTYNTDGSIQAPDGVYLRPAAPMLESAEIFATGNRVKAKLSGESAGAEGYDYVISENINCIKDKDYLQVSKNILDTETNFHYIQKGTYYVYCHAWLRDENGKKKFSPWSNYKKVTVTATTPEQPEITDIRVNGSAVTVTYTKCADATGYDLILGSAYKSVNGEKRPVDYGNLVKKVKNGDTLTVTFRNVPKGRYFAALHSWNRTSEDGKKVFSPWSKSRRIIVK